MNATVLLARLKLCQVRGMLRGLRGQSRFKILVLTLFGAGFWVALFWMFFFGLDFVRRHVPDQASTIHNYLFAIFFLALFVLLTVSNGLISYASLFRARDTAFLLASPLRAESIFAYKYVESLSFSSWSVLFLGAPVLMAYGLGEGVSPIFYPALLVLFVPFVLLPGALGVLLALMFSHLLTRYRRGLTLLFGLVVPVGVYLVASRLISEGHQANLFDALWIQEIFQKISFVQHPLLPSYWMNQGVFAIQSERWSEALFWWLLLLSNALFVFQIGFLAARIRFRKVWSAVRSLGRRRRIRTGRFLDRFLRVFFRFLRPSTRLFLAKDIRIFFRDPVQLGQFLVLVGLLWLYVLNLRVLSYDGQRLSWRMIIAFLNLGATSLTLTTLASRFVFPMLSLEGQRFWILGVVPVSRESILSGKFVFALTGLSFVSIGLAVGSSVMLRLPPLMTGLQCGVMLLVSLGISGLSVGLGALYPNFQEDDPSKIVAGFGGTLNLILSLGYIVMVLGACGVGAHLLLVRSGGRALAWNPWCLIPFGVAVMVSILACSLPLRLGRAHFGRLEL